MGDVCGIYTDEMNRKYSSPYYLSEETRRNSFQNIPKHLRSKSELMIKAGLFYSGKDDVVECFCCGVIFGGWKPSEDPIDSHSKIPDCKYIQKLVFWRFIKKCLLFFILIIPYILIANLSIMNYFVVFIMSIFFSHLIIRINEINYNFFE